ncbi:uncharacterized protein LOC129612781 [Condylostylus longicornis]|uniref:uncharacterized protein LOC129612781 n=1 Tax=Condylostylus longicornis TaxID=2530218 RepID=UPI00244E4B72|nr:uncharacterized protein LOC129612781 [Condylostylus longicornis]
MSCFVKNCGNYPYKKSIRNMRFFRFPSDKSLFRKWVKACGIEVNERQDNMRVCQNHFADEDYRLQDILLKTDLMKRRLKPGAVPSKNLPPRINSIESREECNHELKGETEHIAIESNSCETICCVKSCFSTKKCGKISFFKFPEDVNRKQEWEKLLKLENDLANEMEICSMHFKKKYLIEEGEHLTLSEDAIPTIRVGPPITEKIEKGIKLPESKKKIQQPSKMQKPYKMPIMFVSCSTLGEENDEDDENIGLLSLKNKILQQSGKFKNSNAPLKLKKTLELTSETKTNSPLTEYITSTAFVFGSNVSFKLQGEKN